MAYDICDIISIIGICMQIHTWNVRLCVFRWDTWDTKQQEICIWSHANHGPWFFGVDQRSASWVIESCRMDCPWLGIQGNHPQNASKNPSSPYQVPRKSSEKTIVLKSTINWWRKTLSWTISSEETVDKNRSPTVYCYHPQHKNSKPYLISTRYPLIIKHGLLENIPLTTPSISWGHIWEQRKVNGLESLESPLLTTTSHEITIDFPWNPSKSVSKPKWNPWHSH